MSELNSFNEKLAMLLPQFQIMFIIFTYHTEDISLLDIFRITSKQTVSQCTVCTVKEYILNTIDYTHFFIECTIYPEHRVTL